MSGIFGFSYLNPDCTASEDALGGLSYWNRIYGREASGERMLQGSGIGCHVEHFSNIFPFGGPILEENGTLAVVDALLYNRDELLPQLQLEADSMISDEELLLRWIRVRGFDALAQVNGDFAGAIFDPIKKEWTLFRDQMGVRPLYYYLDEHIFVFSTDMTGIISVPGVDTAINYIPLYNRTIGILSLPGLETEFKNIHCFRPGSVCTVRQCDGIFQMYTHVYWKVRQKKIRLPSDEDYRKELYRLVTDAVHRRCDAIPGLLGAELSGGLDSSTIDIILNRYGREAVYYCWSSDPDLIPVTDESDERHVVFDICRQEQIKCRFRREEDEFDLDYILSQAMPPYIETPHLCYGSRWMHSEGARAVFTGHGGDEGVSHRASRFELLYNGELLSYFQLYWQDTKGLPLRFLRTIHRGVAEARFRWNGQKVSPPDDILHSPYFTAEFVENILRELKLKPVPYNYAPHQYIDDGGSRNRLDVTAYFGAFAGVRYLFPYVDHRVMDFAVSIPRRLHINHQTNRLIFRETFADLMPPSLREVTYKDIPSGRNVDRLALFNRYGRSNMEHLLSRLNPEMWGSVFDIDGIRRIISQNVENETELIQLKRLNSRLMQCIIIQNTLKEAPKWRERND